MSAAKAVVVELDLMLEALGRALGRVPAAVTPDAIAQLRTGVRWTQVEDWEAFSDKELAVKTGLLRVPFSGSVLVVTESSFAPKQGAFLVPASQLSEFVAGHLESYGECFFNGDVIVLETSGQRVWVFHHEGLHALIHSHSDN
jgi:hypothetical protein